MRSASTPAITALGWLLATHCSAARVGPIPSEVRREFKLAPFYQKWVDIHGLPIVSSAKVHDAALLEAHWLIDKMIGHRPEVLRAMAKNQVRFSVMAYNELTTDIPEHSDLRPKKFWDRRARGLGATRVRPSVSCGEENLLKFAGDPYSTENILIHEFAHAIHEMGLNTVDPSFNSRLRAAYDQAMNAGLWKDKYAASNHGEYWAEAVQSWFDTNRENDHDHNHVNTRAELKKYDPRVAALVKEVFGERTWRYSAPATRRRLEHLRGYDPRKAPKFAWPANLAENVPRNPPANTGAPELKREPLKSLRSIRSRQSGDATKITFVNRRREAVSYHWIDFQGKVVRYGTVAAGGTVTQETFAGHVWVVMAKRKALAVVRATKAAGQVAVK